MIKNILVLFIMIQYRKECEIAAHPLFCEGFMVSALSAVKAVVSFEENKFGTNRVRTVPAECGSSTNKPVFEQREREGALLAIATYLCNFISTVNVAEYNCINFDRCIATALLIGHSQGSSVVNRPAQELFLYTKNLFYPVTPHSPTKTWAWLVLGGDDKQIKWN